MKLSKIYSNKPSFFDPVEFLPGLNVVVAEIRLPENLKKDTHNLGKTTLGRLIDFILLDDRDAAFFLFKHFDRFSEFVFFLELEITATSYVTIRRSVQEASKISFKKHRSRQQDYTNLSDGEWDHFNVPFDRAKELLDALLDWRALNPWSFRKTLGYMLRTQDDFREVFKLQKFSSKHLDWKPFLAHLMGFNGLLLNEHYKKEEERKEKEETAETIRQELGGATVEDISKIEGFLLLKRQEIEKKQALLDAFDFRAQDKARTKELVDEIDERIAALNAERYSLSQALKKIKSSLEEDEIQFSTQEAERLFNEVRVNFEGQLKRDFVQLLAFNKAITEERRGYLEQERLETEAELKRVNSELSVFGKKRSDALAFLSTTDVFSKYKEVSDGLATLRADIIGLERRRGFLKRLQDLRAQIRDLTEQCQALQVKIENDVETQNSDTKSLFSQIRILFSEIIEDVLDRKALLSVSPNQLGHLEFKVDILDETGVATSAGLGHTYRKLLCIAFDLAILRARLRENAPRFVYEDGAFESLDDRKKENLLAVLRKYAEIGIQPIITAIDSDFPREGFINESEIVLRLHDEGERGRLFKIPSW